MKSQNKLWLSVSLFSLVVSLLACGKRGSSPTDDPTSGKIHITVDESYQPVMEDEEFLFESLYPHADVSITYANEKKCFEDLLADSSRFVVVNRELNESEMSYFNSIELTPRVTKIAFDGLAFIVNNEARLNKLLYNQVGDLFSGKIGTWKQINNNLSNDSLKIIFDHPNSGNVRMINERFKLNGKLPGNCFAVNSNPEVISYVEKNKNAIGIISVNWISDDADTNALSFLKKIKVLAIGQEGVEDTTGACYGPYQGYIAADMYPLKRSAYIISREARAGLGTGFASFIAGEKGQRIILKSGMVPAVAPVRIIEFNQ